MTHTDSRAVFRAIYFINSVTISDRGTYTCTVTNPIGSDSEIISVNGRYILISNHIIGI